MKAVFYILFLLVALPCFSQSHLTTLGKKNDWRNFYQATENKVNDLVHTKLDVRFDFKKAYLYGKAWITLQPHFYPANFLKLDAKGMDIHEVSIIKNGTRKNLKYIYDSLELAIILDTVYKRNEQYTVYIQYTAKPNEYKVKGSKTINDAKGLYFINPGGTEKDKPTQIWTQGETESNSVWFPTIDKPNQKSTEEINMTIPDRYVTLSNGLLINQKNNTDGTRTDTWKLDLPHAPYLFFMGAGEFAVVKDWYKGKEVSYFVEKEYEKVARKIFGNTPEMIAYFSRITGIEYPWPKYAQMVGRDFVSGAMENTTATLHQETAQQNARELMDGNIWETTIAHELFHQWFGDLATCESWSNLTLNEGFANYSETLWNEYKYGKDAGEEQNYNDMRLYLQGDNSDKDLIRYYYYDKEDLFDAVSYNKGGRVLHMLRHYVGDDAFFTAMNSYLTKNKFKTVEAAQLRMAFEEVTGYDLNWFWNQWFYDSSHPSLKISYEYNLPKKTVNVIICQAQENKVFKLPIDIDIYEADKKTRHNVWMNRKCDTFTFATAYKPHLINVDADKVLLATKIDDKTIQEYIYQYNHAGNYVDRREAIDYASLHPKEKGSTELLVTALSDTFHSIRRIALSNIAYRNVDSNIIAKIERVATNDPFRPNRALAIAFLGDLQNDKYKELFLRSVKDSSYSVAAASLTALSAIDENAALALVPELKKDARNALATAIEDISILNRSHTDFDSIFAEYKSGTPFDKISRTFSLLTYLSKINNPFNFKMAIDEVVRFREYMGEYDPDYRMMINREFQKLKRKKEISINGASCNSCSVEEEIKYLDKVLN